MSNMLNEASLTKITSPLSWLKEGTVGLKEFMVGRSVPPVR